jgi:peptidoglycan-associated lipoprotein
MRFFKSILVLFVCLSLATLANAQNKKIKQADNEFAGQGYEAAAKLYRAEVAKIKNPDEKGRVYYNMAECYRNTKRYNASLEFYDKAITAKYDKKTADVYLNYGLALQEMGRLEDAIVQYNKYKERGGNAAVADMRIQTCINAKTEGKKSDKSRYIAVNVEKLNSSEEDFGLAYASKKWDEFVFTSSRKESMGSTKSPINGDDLKDVYFVKMDKKFIFQGSAHPVAVINTEGNEATGAFDKDYKTLYFTKCGYEPKSRMGCDIMYSDRMSIKKEQVKEDKKDNVEADLNAEILTFSEPKIIEIPGIDRVTDDSTRVGQPCLSADEQYLIFASNMRGGKGGRDLWYMTYDKKAKKWANLTNLDSVNTPGDEYYPYLAEDGTLYFASNGYPGLGGLDIYKAKKTGEMKYGDVTAMPAPINSSADDFAFIIDKKPVADGVLMEGIFACYISSNRPGGKGKDDIWHIYERPLEFTMTGTAYDRKSGNTLSGCKVTIMGTDGSTYNITTDATGSFFLDKKMVKAETKYTVDIQKENYIGTADKFSTKGAKESTNYQQDYFLIPVEIGKEYPMPTVLYPFTKSELLINDEVNSADSLSYLLNILNENPTFVVQLESHTDARGDTPSNDKLSQARAETCVRYLTSKGIAAERLVAKGKGESEPRIIKDGDRLTNEIFAEFPVGTTLDEAFINAITDKDASERAHQLNRRTTFRILRTDYVPKK